MFFTMLNFELREAPLLLARDTAKIWVISDIQQVDPAKALEFLSAAVDDILELKLFLDAVWILGDALRAADETALEQVADVFVNQMARLNLPIAYLLGNHDMDFRRTSGRNRYPLWERAQKESNWSTMDHLDDFFFARRIGNNLIVFLGDHADPNGDWFTSHGHAEEKVKGSYSHSPADYSRLQTAMAAFGGPVVIASHYAVAGGQKPSGLLNQLLPLPENVKILMHGHAHIGDLVWNKEDPWERDHAVSSQTLRQYNISALESLRSEGSHSAVLDLGPSGPIQLRIRSHQDRTWQKSYPAE